MFGRGVPNNENDVNIVKTVVLKLSLSSSGVWSCGLTEIDKNNSDPSYVDLTQCSKPCYDVIFCSHK